MISPILPISALDVWIQILNSKGYKLPPETVVRVEHTKHIERDGWDEQRFKFRIGN